MKIKNWFLDVLKGGSLGLGMIPGVSAGTMGLIVGIYDRLITGIANLKKEFKKSLISLIPLGIGAVMSAVICMLGVNYGLDYAPFAIISLFAGLIIGSLPVITKELKGVKPNVKSVIIVVIGAVFAAGIGILSAVAKLNNWGNFEAAFIAGDWWIYIAVFAAGFIAAMACIIPGISGAMLLFVAGLYDPCVHIFVGENSIIHNSARLVSGIFLTLSLLVGIAAGFILTSKLMKSLLAKHHDGTYLAVFGFILGSLVSMYVNQSMINDSLVWKYTLVQPWEWVLGIVLLVGFAVLFFFLSKLALKKQASIPQKEETEPASK